MYSSYLDSVLQDLWSWADEHHQAKLDGGKRQDRPPVLSKEFSSLCVLVPQDASIARAIRAVIPKSKRHRWFRSLKSSQALSQSILGAVDVFNCLHLLQDVQAECGRPAFFEQDSGFVLEFEHEVRWLAEPQPTSIDVLLRGSRRHVVIECKFTEREFGTCSRPHKPHASKQHCNGNYEVQSGRHERCALTEIGIQYWRYLPDLFEWEAHRDHVPCPFGEVYQLARNALAAGVAPGSPAPGHVLVVYDARNPEFKAHGRAEQQWRSAVSSCRVPGLLRRLSWQRLLTALTRASELAYLIEGVEQKYGLRPA